MKNALKLFGIIALVAVIGFSMVACGGDDNGGGGGGGGGSGSGGVFALTDIPSEYNGKYVYGFQRLENGSYIYVSTTKPNGSSLSTMYGNGCRISNGKVNMPMWEGLSTYERYTGNDTTGLSIQIKDSDAGYWEATTLQVKNWRGTFRNGNASASWNDLQ